MMLAINVNNESLQARIENARKEMTELKEVFGLTHTLTVAKSQELDHYLNEYMLKQL